jgi:transposase-like protein
MVMQPGEGMGAPVSIRTDIPADELSRLARQESNGRVTCRLMALANALDGMRRAQAAHQAEVDRQTLRDWVIRFNAEGVERPARSAQERPPELARRQPAGDLQGAGAARPRARRHEGHAAILFLGAGLLLTSAFSFVSAGEPLA